MFFVIVAVSVTFTSFSSGSVTVPSFAITPVLLLLQVIVEPFLPLEASVSCIAEVTVVGSTVSSALSAATSFSSSEASGKRPPCQVRTGNPPLLFSESTLKCLSVGLRASAKASSFISLSSFETVVSLPSVPAYPMPQS